MSQPGHETAELTPDEKMRLAMAARIAAGMAANPATYDSKTWRGDIASEAWSVAGKLISLATRGGF